MRSSTRRASRSQPFGRMRYRNARLIFDNCVEGTGSLSVTECDPAPPTTACCWATRTAYFLVRYLSECWRRLVFAHSPTLDRAVVETVRPDIAMTVIAERFLVVVPDDEDAAARCATARQRKREIGRIRHPLLHWAWPTLMSPGPVEQMRSRLLDEGRVREAALIGLMAYAGLRPAEAMALRWSAIERRLHLRRAPAAPARGRGRAAARAVVAAARRGPRGLARASPAGRATSWSSRLPESRGRSTCGTGATTPIPSSPGTRASRATSPASCAMCSACC